MTRLFFAGSFNPFTRGHHDVVSRALTLFPDAEVVIGLGHNPDKDEAAVDTLLARIRQVYAHDPRVSVIAYSGLTVDAARAAGASALIRALRDTRDFEYEKNLARVNRNISGLETVFIMADPQWEWLSSSIVRELESHGQDISSYLP